MIHVLQVTCHVIFADIPGLQTGELWKFCEKALLSYSLWAVWKLPSILTHFFPGPRGPVRAGPSRVTSRGSGEETPKRPLLSKDVCDVTHQQSQCRHFLKFWHAQKTHHHCPRFIVHITPMGRSLGTCARGVVGSGWRSQTCMWVIFSIPWK